MAIVVQTAKKQITFFTPGHVFNASELWALSVDGILNHIIGDVFVPASIDSNPRIRALSMMHLLPSRIRDKVVLGGKSAAWVWSGCANPDRHSLLYTSNNRFTLKKEIRNFKICHTKLAERDTHTFSWRSNASNQQKSISVTNFERTIYDLLLQEPQHQSMPFIDAMFAVGPQQPAQKINIYTALRRRILTCEECPLSQGQRRTKILPLLNSILPQQAQEACTDPSLVEVPVHSSWLARYTS